MELRHLKYFAAVAEHGSFTKAAEQLFTAQPSLSQQIKDLEAEVGVQLIDRSSKQIKLTDEGLAFLKHALNAIESANLAAAAAVFYQIWEVVVIFPAVIFYTNQFLHVIPITWMLGLLIVFHSPQRLC